jgi:hypothetical protein
LAGNGVPKRELGNQEKESCQPSAAQHLHGFFSRTAASKYSWWHLAGTAHRLEACATDATQWLQRLVAFLAFAFPNG